VRLETGDVVKVKVHASRKREDGRFAIEGRPVDLPRVVRERVEKTLAE
jgi:hypothetical protein